MHTYRRTYIDLEYLENIEPIYTQKNKMHGSVKVSVWQEPMAADVLWPLCQYITLHTDANIPLMEPFLHCQRQWVHP